jgi:hypothetical protein
VPSYRWFNLLPLVILYLGLGFFLLQFFPPMRTHRALAIGLIFAALHPEFLMWSNTFRWFCPWTGLALAALGLFLQPRKEVWALGWFGATAGGLLLASMFYLNYITLIALVALLPALWLRFRGHSVPQSRRWLYLSAVIFLTLSAPQLHTMLTVHMANSSGQRSTLLVSVLRLLQAIAGSEAYLPWRPLALLASVAVAIGLALGVIALCGKSPTARRDGAAQLGSSYEQTLILFAAVFLLALMLTGLGGKPRSAILLLPVLAPAVARGAERLPGLYQLALLLLLACWSCVGGVHLIGRYGLQKASMNERPEDVVTLIERNQHAADALHRPAVHCGIAVTYDDAVAFGLAARHIPELLILSAESGSLFAGTLNSLPSTCASPYLYLIRSYLSGIPQKDGKYSGQIDAARQFFLASPSVTNLSPDPQAAMKRRLSHWLGLSAGTALPDFRFTVTSGQFDRARLPAVRATLSYFTSGDEVVSDSLVPVPDQR